jgi:hypothetical protein
MMLETIAVPAAKQNSKKRNISKGFGPPVAGINSPVSSSMLPASPMFWCAMIISLAVAV